MQKGFVLTDLLVATVVMPLVASGFLFFVYMITKLNLEIVDQISAAESFRDASKIVSLYVENAGLGLSRSITSYRDSFYNSIRAPFNWDGALCIGRTPAPNVREDALLQVVFAIPTGVRSKIAVSTDEQSFSVILNGGLNNGLYSSASDGSMNIDSFFIFPSAEPRTPLRIHDRHTNTTSGTICNFARSVRGVLSIPQNDELFYLRAAQISTRYDTGDKKYYMVTNDFLGDGNQSRVRGIVDMRFAFIEERGTMKVFFLVQGSRRYEDKISDGAPDGWPNEWVRDIPDEARYHKLFAFEREFRVLNY